MFVNASGRNQQSLHASYQVSLHLPKRFLRRRFLRNLPIRNKNCLWRTCLLTIGTKWAIFIEELPQMLPTKFRFIWPGVFKRRRFFQKSTNQKQELLVAAIFVKNGSDEMSTNYRGPSIDAAYQWWPCFLMDRDKMCNLQKGPSIVPQMLPTKFQFSQLRGFSGED